MNWLEKNSKALQALAAIATIIFGLGALIGAKLQIDASARLQQEQSARDIYREFLSLSVQNPDFAEPDFCDLDASAKSGAYDAYVGHMLYVSEQVLRAFPL